MTYPSVRRWLVEHTPLEPSLLEGAGFEILVAERISALGGGEPAYISALACSADEVDRLTAGIAVPETWLFRYPRSFELLVDFLGRRLAAGAPLLRMISIGCATGQEPYGMAMAALHAGWPAERVRVEGLDRNSGFLRIASAAEYSAASIRSEIPGWAAPFFRRNGDAICIDQAVRAVVRFVQADVTGPGALRDVGPCDVIFCRNVLIYLNAEARARLLDSICAALAPAGLVFVGHAEQVIRGAAPLRPVPAPHAFALERADAPGPAVVRHPTPGIAPGRSAAPLLPIPAPAFLAAPQVALSMPSALIPAVFSDAAEQTLDDARDLADAGRMQDGEAVIRSIIARRGPSAQAYELLGMIRIAADDASGAKRLFEQAVYLEPERPASLLQLAMISERAGDPERAAVLWGRARRAANGDDQERRS